MLEGCESCGDSIPLESRIVIACGGKEATLGEILILPILFMSERKRRGVDLEGKLGSRLSRCQYQSYGLLPFSLRGC